MDVSLALKLLNLPESISLVDQGKVVNAYAKIQTNVADMSISSEEVKAALTTITLPVFLEDTIEWEAPDIEPNKEGDSKGFDKEDEILEL